MANPRDRALELIEEGIVSAEDMVTMCVKYMSVDDVEDMLDCNELSDRFMEDDEDDGQPDWHQEWEDFGECYEQHSQAIRDPDLDRRGLGHSDGL